MRNYVSYFCSDEYLHSDIEERETKAFGSLLCDHAHLIVQTAYGVIQIIRHTLGGVNKVVIRTFFAF